ncbi:hypothetical protein [Litorilituus lipolyticus]|uniref:DUF5666 domain-containing protein n=1 Tax=Litorilituus lipolyticus TaxID=2491017 RepID=A0A502L517_9GAMM|nr:hypothetical protein [Litorilituus lipolyticus]TPH18039.1 hypothetical protein EPA86_02680 [Litorilituus lipolyticus]
MKLLLSTAVLVSAMAITFPTSADVLTLKDGQSITGTLVSRDANGVVFEVAGQQLTFKSENIADISFGNVKAKQAATNDAPVKADKPAQKPVAEKADKSVTVPTGTRLVVRTNASINSKQHKAGHKFTSRLEADLVIDDTVVARRGSMIYGVVNEAKRSGRLAGRSSIELKFTDIMINNQMMPISTSGVKAVTEGTAKSTVGTTARAAAIGGLINGSKGARDGAKVGAGVSILTSGNQVNIPSGTMLEFQLTAPFKAK